MRRPFRSSRESNTQAAEPCFKHHGRLTSKNGIALTIWLIGTSRIVAVDNDLDEFPALMRKYLEITSPSHSYIYGDYEICPLQPDKPGHMRPVRVIGAEKLVVQDVRAQRPPFRLLTSWRPEQDLQLPPQSSEAILDGAAADVRRSEPSWQFAKPVCNLPPLMDEQKTFSCGSWFRRRSSDLDLIITATVHEIATPNAVSRWMNSTAAEARPGWIKARHDIGVLAYLSVHQTTPQADIVFGRGRFVVTVNGKSKVDVERVARSLLRQINDFTFR